MKLLKKWKWPWFGCLVFWLMRRKTKLLQSPLWLVLLAGVWRKVWEELGTGGVTLIPVISFCHHYKSTEIISTQLLTARSGLRKAELTITITNGINLMESLPHLSWLLLAEVGLYDCWLVIVYVSSKLSWVMLDTKYPANWTNEIWHCFSGKTETSYTLRVQQQRQEIFMVMEY